MAQVLHSPHEHASPQVLVFIVCPLVLLLIVRFATSTTTTRRADKLLDRLPSPPNKLPLIGHLHLVGSLPHISLRNLAEKHGPDVMLLRLGAIPSLVVSSARAAMAVLRTHDHVFASRVQSAMTDILYYGSTDMGFSPYGDYWRQIRKITATHLLSSKKVGSYRLARENEVQDAMARIRAAAARSTAVDLSKLLSSFTTDIVCHAVSGKSFRGGGRNELFRELVETSSKLIGGFNLEDYFPKLARLDVVRRMVCARAERIKKKWDDLLDEIINDHAKNTMLDHEINQDRETDFIDVLLSIQQEYNLTRENVKAVLVDMFIGGTDTSFIVLDCAMAELIQNPEVMTKLQAEVRSVAEGKEMVTEEDLNGMIYLKGVIKETLRLHSPVPLFLPHLSMADCDIEGYTIPSGTRVIINGWALARDPAYWESAEEFMPERFMENVGSTMIHDFKGSNFHYLPFGTGRRVCPGMNFGMATVEIMLANLMYHFNWDLPAATVKINMTESFGVTMGRKENLILVPALAQKQV
uniref:Cytochrome P450 71C4 n=4 Tax=Aegilops tauschii subsp. strangulata TaxID=200361 RepID=A0A453MRT9_AEGTS|nr:indole-2-monooxygenase-like [Aegilops tauschii subsp. strangulata]